MANNGNLIPQAHTLTVEEQSRGGIKSGEVRREKANLRKQLQVFLESDATLDKYGNPLTGAELMVKVAVREMMKGNPKFWELIRDTAGYKPTEKIQLSEIDQDIIDEVEAMVLGTEEEPAYFPQIASE